MCSVFSFACLENRWTIRAKLVMDTALHIGSGEGADAVDAGVVLDRHGRPYVPGSSLKGVLRSEAERAASLLGQSACGLFSSNGVPCLTTDKDKAKSIRDDIKRNKGLSAELHSQLERELCDSCRLFGSQFAASRVQIDDLFLDDSENVVIESRDGVGIDRDSGTAAEHIKYDFHVVPASTEFALHIQAENLDKRSRSLFAFVVLELTRGNYSIGGKRSRGLGRCHLRQLSIQKFEFASPKDMLAYLSGDSAFLDENMSLAYLAECVKGGLANA